MTLLTQCQKENVLVHDCATSNTTTEFSDKSHFMPCQFRAIIEHFAPSQADITLDCVKNPKHNIEIFNWVVNIFTLKPKSIKTVPEIFIIK